MKQTYMVPSVRSVRVESCAVICRSGVSSNNSIGYGGVDGTGEKDPAARRHIDVWEDEEDEEQ